MKFISLFVSLLAITLNTSSSLAQSKNGWTRYQNYKIHLDPPSDWQIERDLYGMPITVLGPMRDGERAVLGVQHAPVYDLNFDHELLKKTKNDYYTGRKAWVSKKESGEYLGELPYRRLRWQNGNDGFELGFRYSNEGVKYEEHSVQVNCGGRLYFVKTHSSEKATKEDRAVLAKLVNELNCINTTKADGAYEPSPMQDLALKVRDLMEPSPWPTRKQIKTATTDQKVAMLVAVKEFYKDMENNSVEDSFALNPVVPGKERAFAKIKDRMDRFVSAFVGTAFASEEYNCFFAGWPSKFVKKHGVSTCGYPWDTNDKYDTAKESCKEGELACNPSLFGSGVCVSTKDSSVRNHATMVCDAKFASTGKSFDDVVNDPKYDQENLQETVDSAKSVCAEEPYRSENYGLCSTLKEKLGLAINIQKITPDDQSEAFLNNIEKLKPEDYGPAVDTFKQNWKAFEAECREENGEFKTTGDCPDALLHMKTDMEMLEKAGVDIESELQKQEDENPTTDKNKHCINCGGPEGTNTPESEVKEKTAEDGKETAACSSDDDKKNAKKTLGDCAKENFLYEGSNAVSSFFGSLAKSSVAGLKCVGNALMGLFRSLWDTITAILGLIWDGIKWVGNKIWTGVKWLFGCSEVEDKTSDKLEAAGKTNNGVISEFKKDPIGTIKGMFTNILDAIGDYANETTYCEEWDSSPPMAPWANCTKPGNSACRSCSARLQGACGSVGYVVGEIAPSLFTGGATTALKGTAMGVKVVKFLKNAKRAGKLMKMEKNFAKIEKGIVKATKAGAKPRFNMKLVGKAKDTKAALTGFTKMEKIAGKVYNLTRWPNNLLRRVKSSFFAGKKGILEFKSARGESFKQVMAKLTSYQNKNFVQKAGVFVLKAGIETGKVAAIPVKIAGSGIKSVMTGMYKVAKGGIKLVTLPVTGSEKIYSYVQRGVAKYGFKSGEKLFAKSAERHLANLTETEKRAYQVFGKKNTIESIGKLSTRAQYIKYGTNYNRYLEDKISIDWATDEEIQKQADALNIEPSEAKKLIKINRAGRVTQANIERAVQSGEQVDRKDIQLLATLKDKTVEDVIAGTGGVIESKLTATSMGVITANFTDAEYAAYAKVNDLSAKVAKTNLLTEKACKKLDQIFGGIEPKFSSEELAAYGKTYHLNAEQTQQALKEILIKAQKEIDSGKISEDPLCPNPPAPESSP